MASVDEDEYYEMNFVPMNGLPFGVATINRESLPWQLLVADSYHSHNTDEDGDAVEVHGIKCWDSNKMVKLTLEYLPCKFECTARPKLSAIFSSLQYYLTIDRTFSTLSNGRKAYCDCYCRNFREKGTEPRIKSTNKQNDSIL